MSITIDQAFIKEYEDEVMLAYQQRGSKLRGTVRIKPGLIGESVRFQKLGTGEAQAKARHGLIPPMNPDHSYVDVTIADWYAADYADKADLFKTNIDERTALINTGAYAIGRKVDSIVITALDATGNTIAVDARGLDKKKILNAFEDLNDNNVPDDGQRFCIVGPHQWNELLNMTEFKSADYVGASNLPWLAGTEVKQWLNIYWMMHTGLPLSAAPTRKCFMYHKLSTGLAEHPDVKTDMAWIAERAAYFVNNYVGAGSTIIDDNGVIEISCKNDTAVG